jgi:O-acetyl-ADP-ribose deacetylase (regulator of RNase III)
VAFPAISCGVYGYPIREAAQIAVRTVAAFAEYAGRPALVRFVLFNNETYSAFEEALKALED